MADRDGPEGPAQMPEEGEALAMVFGLCNISEEKCCVFEELSLLWW